MKSLEAWASRGGGGARGTPAVIFEFILQHTYYCLILAALHLVAQ